MTRSSILLPIVVAVSSAVISFSVSWPQETEENLEASFDAETEDMLTRERLQSLQDEYPYYLSGFDKQSNPVWVIDFGQWDVRKVTSSNRQEFRNYVDQMIATWTGSPGLYSTPHQNLTAFTLISDLDGYSLLQFMHFGANQEFYYIVQKFRTEVLKFKNLNRDYAVNANHLFRVIFNVASPLFGNTLSRISVYGTNRDEWLQVLVDDLGREALPDKFFPEKAD